MAEKADAMIKPMITVMTSVKTDWYGSTSVKGCTEDRKENDVFSSVPVAEEPSEQSPYGQCREKQIGKVVIVVP